MTQDAMRAAFEKWLSRKWFTYHYNEARQRYDNNEQQGAWRAWQSREAEVQTLKEQFGEALKLLWFFLPEHEPDPHAKDAKTQEKNRRWRLACELYHDNYQALTPAKESKDA